MTSLLPTFRRACPIPVPEPDGVSAPYWNSLREALLVQRCAHYRQAWQFGPEWICHVPRNSTHLGRGAGRA